MRHLPLRIADCGLRIDPQIRNPQSAIRNCSSAHDASHRHCRRRGQRQEPGRRATCASLGAGVLDADRAGHEVLRMPEVERRPARPLGATASSAPTGTWIARRWRKIVFAPGDRGPRERKYLEQLTHPEIGDAAGGTSRTNLPRRGCPAVVLDAPLLLEAGWDDLCDKIVFVDAPREVRLSRREARGWSEEDFAAREAAQESLDAKRRRADVIIDNSGSPEPTQAQVERFWRTLVG